MLPQHHRLRHRADVLRVRNLGKPYRHPLAILVVVRAESREDSDTLNALPATRFAFSAGRRVGTAVTRNRSKRLLREAVREQLSQVEPGWDCLFIAREGTPAAGYVAVKSAAATLLRRARLLREPPSGR